MNLMNASQTASKLKLISERFSEVVENKKKIFRIATQSGVEENESTTLIAKNKKRFRTYNQHELENALFDGVRSNYALTKMIKELDLEGIYLTEKKAKIWAFTQEAVNKMALSLGKRLPYSRQGKMHRIIISNLKGGVGKSSLTINLAGGLATSAYHGYKILVIDLDPQGSLTNTYSPFLVEGEYISVGDLLCNNVELAEGETFSDAVHSACLETNIPDLDIIPADTSDIIFDAFVRNKQFEARKTGIPFSAHDAFEPIMDALKNTYDIVIIDTPPRVSEAVVAAHFSATSVIVPMRPAQGDHDSSTKYLYNLKTLYSQFSELGHKGYDFIKLIQVGAMGGSESELKTSRKIKSKLGGMCLPDFKNSEAVKRCSDTFKGIFEVSPSEYSKRESSNTKAAKTTQQGSRVSLINAQENVTDIVLELEAALQESWDHELEGEE